MRIIFAIFAFPTMSFVTFTVEPHWLHATHILKTSRCIWNFRGKILHGAKRNFWPRTMCACRAIFHISNTLRKLMI